MCTCTDRGDDVDGQRRRRKDHDDGIARLRVRSCVTDQVVQVAFRAHTERVHDSVAPCADEGGTGAVRWCSKCSAWSREGRVARRGMSGHTVHEASAGVNVMIDHRRCAEHKATPHASLVLVQALLLLVVEPPRSLPTDG